MNSKNSGDLIISLLDNRNTCVFAYVGIHDNLENFIGYTGDSLALFIID